MENSYIGVANTDIYSKTSVPGYHEPMDGPTMGLMMMLSVFQYQAPYMNPVYSEAARNAGKAAYMQSGGQEAEDGIKRFAGDKAIGMAHQIGLTDTGMGVVLGSVKVYRNRQIDINGPRIYFVHTHLTLSENNGSVGLGWNW